MARRIEWLKRLRETVIDFALGDHPKLAVWMLGGLLAAMWLILVLALAGLIGATGAREKILIPSEAGQSPVIVQWAADLRLEGRPEAGLAGLTSASPAEKAWLNDKLCYRSLSGPGERSGRAWRVRHNPALCDPLARGLAVMPLNIQLGWLVGLSISLLIVLGLAYVIVVGLLWLVRVGVAYRRLYASEHRVDRVSAAG